MTFSEGLRFRVPHGVRDALAVVASERQQTVPELLRQMVRNQLDEDDATRRGNSVALEWEEPHGQHLPEVSTRRTFPPDLAAGIRSGLKASGLSLRQAAEIIGIDNSYLCRLAQGTRCPSFRVAFRLVTRLPIDDETADALLDLAREHPGV